MARIAIRYCTQTGHSRQLAEAIGQALNLPAADISERLEEPVDKLFLCNGMYAARLDKRLTAFLAENAGLCGEIINVCSSASGRSTGKLMRKQAEALHFTLSKREFCCKGAFHFLSKGHPDASDLKAVSDFAVVAAM